MSDDEAVLMYWLLQCAVVCSPRLTWRDLQHIVVLTARQANLDAEDWAKNGVGRLGQCVHQTFTCYMPMIKMGAGGLILVLIMICRKFLKRQQWKPLFYSSCYIPLRFSVNTQHFRSVGSVGVDWLCRRFDLFDLRVILFHVDECVSSFVFLLLASEGRVEWL